MLLAFSRKLCSKTSRSRFCSHIFDGYKNSFVIYRNNNNSELISSNIIQCRGCSDVARNQKKGRQRQNEPKNICIPDKIHRSPTALLEALSETVGEDPTGHGWDFIDDPFLLPYTEKDREDYKAAHHFGESAADMVFRNMPQLFTMDTAIPKIEQFYPHPLQIEAKGGIGLLNSSGWSDSFDYEGDKIDRIAESYSLDEKIEYFTLTRKVEEAIKFFEALSDDQKLSLSQEALSQLFCLLAYFGNVDRQPTPLPVAAVSSIKAAEKLNPSDDVIQAIDELTNSPSDVLAETPHMDENCLARQIFDMIEPKIASHYSTMIKSLARFGSKKEAYFMFEEQLKAGMQFDVTVFNDIILCWGSTGSSGDSDTFGVSYPEYVTGVLTQMRDSGVAPDANTFNSVLKGIEDAESCDKLLMPTMREMEVLGMKPSLAVYANFLRLAISTKTRAYRNASPSARTVHYETIVAVLQRALKEHAHFETSISESDATGMPHVDAFGFLQMAMTTVLISGKMNLFDAVHEFAQRNAVLLKMDSDRSAYFKKYIQALSRFSDSADWVDRFFAVVPTKFTPTVNMLIVEVLPEIAQRQRYDCLPKMWSILKLCNYAMISQLLLNNFCALLNDQSDVPNYNMTDSQKVDIADDVCNILDMVSETSMRSKKRSGRDKRPVKLNSELLRCLLDVYISTNQVTKAASLFIAGTRMISNVRATAFADIIEMFWEENRPTEAESFCVECIDNISPQSGKIPELVDIFKDQFSSGMPPKITKQMQDGFLSQDDLDLMQKTAHDTVDMVVAYSQRRSVE